MIWFRSFWNGSESLHFMNEQPNRLSGRKYTWISDSSHQKVFILQDVLIVHTIASIALVFAVRIVSYLDLIS